jgi:hypothetical protein
VDSAGEILAWSPYEGYDSYLDIVRFPVTSAGWYQFVVHSYGIGAYQFTLTVD